MFWPDGWDWRWLSWDAALARGAGLVRWLAPLLSGLEKAPGRGRPPRVAHAWHTGPASLLLDAALVSAGALSWPALDSPAAAGSGAAGENRAAVPEGCWWLAVPGAPDAASGAPPAGARPLPLGGARGSTGLGTAGPGDRLAALLRVDGTLPEADTEEPETGWPETSAEGGAVVLGRSAEGGPPGFQDRTWAAVLRQARELDEALARPRRPEPRPEQREILVLADAPRDAPRRRLLTWALMRGAALVLEPRPASHVGTALWARPTVFAGTAAEVADLLRRAASDAASGIFRRLRRLGRSPRPLGALGGRLHTCLVLPPRERRTGAELSVEDLRSLPGATDVRILPVEARITSGPRRKSTEELND